MFAKNLMKYPALVMGLIMFGIFLSQESTHKWWKNQKRRFIPSTCDAVMNRVKPNAPSSWKISCPTTQHLTINISTFSNVPYSQKLRSDLYKQLANMYSKLAHYANKKLPYVEKGKQKVYNDIETLERLGYISIVIEHPNLVITSKSDGMAVSRYIRFKTAKQIAQHLKLTVKVSEKRPR